MSGTDNTTKDWRDETAPARRRTDGMIRRMPIGVNAGVAWRVTGHLLQDNRTREQRDAEVFSGIGFYARPKAGANAEAIVAFLGDDAQNPIIIATRDEAARRAIAQLEQDSTAMFNSSTIILIKKGGTVEIRAGNGAATKLPTLADYEALRTAFNAHVHATAANGPPSPPTAVPGQIPAPTPSGTQVLKAQ